LLKDGKTYRIFADQIDTENKQTLWAWDSKPFGESQPDEDVDKDGNSLSYNLRFPGQYYDQETGKHYNFNRDYDPSTGRYIQSDPIGLDGGMNGYGYVKLSPLDRSDLQGLKYSLKEGKLLATWIKDQWAIFWVYTDMAVNGVVPSNVKFKSIARSPHDCAVYPDEGRRLACEAHEKAHYFGQSMVVAIQIFMGTKKDGIKAVAQAELYPTEAGIKKGESLYGKNCCSLW